MTTKPNPTRERLLAVAEALARIDAAIESLSVAYRVSTQALSSEHNAVLAIDQANERTRVARAKLEIVLRRVP